jgi:hypothetical protein
VIVTMTPCPEPEKVLGVWVGHGCSKILRLDHSWSFQFDDVGGIGAPCPWRIIAEGRIAHADTDDAQKFGLPEPVNGVERATQLLSGKKIVDVEIPSVSGDLHVHFSGKTILEFFNNSSGYEGWQATAKNGPARTNLVAQGGGQIAMWKD